MNKQDYTELPKDVKDDLANRRMEEMKRKNELLMRRYAEVQNDRLEAESRNSAVTSKVVKKENKSESIMPPKQFSREWDQGKEDKNWMPHEQHSSFKNYNRSRSEKNFNKCIQNPAEDSWPEFSPTSNVNYSSSRKSFRDQSEKIYNKGSQNPPQDSWPEFLPTSNLNDTNNGKVSRGIKSRLGERDIKGFKSERGKVPSEDVYHWPSVPKGPKQPTVNQNHFQKDRYHWTRSVQHNKKGESSYKSRSNNDFQDLPSKISSTSLDLFENHNDNTNKNNIVANWVKTVNNTNFEEHYPDEKPKSPRKATKFDRLKHSVEGSDEEDSIVEGSSNNNRRDIAPPKNFKCQGHNLKRQKDFSSSTEREFINKRCNSSTFDYNQVDSGQASKKDSWSSSVMKDNKKVDSKKWCDGDSWNTVEEADVADDGNWTNVQQSNIEWKLSDEEDLQGETSVAKSHEPEGIKAHIQQGELRLNSMETKSDRKDQKRERINWADCCSSVSSLADELKNVKINVKTTV